MNYFLIGLFSIGIILLYISRNESRRRFSKNALDIYFLVLCAFIFLWFAFGAAAHDLGIIDFFAEYPLSIIAFIIVIFVGRRSKELKKAIEKSS